MNEALDLQDLADKRKSTRPARSSKKNFPKRKISWTKTFNKKICIKYRPIGETSYCECGYPKIEHVEKAFESSGDVTITDVPTDGLGTLDFRGSTNRAKAEFVRVSNDTPAKQVFKFMEDFWQMERPRLLISVTGGAKSFNMDPKLKELFAIGLLKVALTPGAWVITGGTNTGVMKHVGEALQGATSACIGIATWGIVSNRETLIAQNENQLGCRFPYVISSSLVGSGAYLDHNHSHFVLVDNGTSGQYGMEIKLRSALEKYIMTKSSLTTEIGGGLVPTVLLVLEGGAGTLDTVQSALTDHPPIPVVVIKDSGRAADCIALALDVIDNVECEEIYEPVMTFIKQRFPELKTEEKRRKAYENVLRCVRRRDSITVFKMSDGSGVDEAILTALLNSYRPDMHHMQRTSHIEQLRLTILWDRADIAEEHILLKVTDWKEQQLTEALIMSLALDRVKFVELFLRYGANLSTTLTEKRMEFLYGYRSKVHRSVCNEFVQRDVEPVFKLLCDYEDIDAEECFVAYSHVNEILSKICKNIRAHKTDKFIDDCNNLSSTLQRFQQRLDRRFEFPFRELFFWAVLNNMQDMAMFLWKFGESGMAKAIIAAEINKVLAAKAKRGDDEESERIHLENLRVFETLGLELLDECFRLSEGSLEQLITTEFRQFPTFTCLDLAVRAKNSNFVAHSAVQLLLNSVWTGAVRRNDLHARECLFGIFFPPFILTFDFVTEQQLKHMIKAEDSVDGDVNKEQRSDKNSSLISNDSESAQKSPKKKYRPNANGKFTEYGRENFEERELSNFKKITSFWKAPIIKFYSNVLAYFAFLCLVAYVAMVKKTDTTQSVPEWIVLSFVVALTIEEIRQLIHGDGNQKSVKYKLKLWAYNFWNMLDAAAIILYYVAFGLRLHKKYLAEAQVVLAFDAGLWFIRLLNVFFAHRILGPYVHMIGKMFVDMMYFLTILVVFLVAYGVTVTALLNPQKSKWKMLQDLVFHPYFNIYGELFVERDSSAGVTRFGTKVINSYSETLAFCLLGVYLLIANVLLLNLLIAIFGNTFTSVQENSAKIWKFQRYSLITEYASRPLLVPPFILLVHFYILFHWIYEKFCLRCCCKAKNERRLNMSSLKSHVTEDEKNDLLDYEMKAIARLLRKKQIGSKEMKAK